MALTPIGKIVLIGKGDYNSSTTYNHLDWVRHNNCAWVCTDDSVTGVEPTSSATEWQLLVQDGAVSTTLGGLSDVNVAGVTNGQTIVYDSTSNEWIASSGGSGHVMAPAPVSSLNEDTVVSTIQSKYNTPTNVEVTSVFSIAHWTNVKRKRIIYSGTIGHTGIGTWKDGEVTSADETDWWTNTAFTLLDNSSPSVDGYDVDFSIKLDPGSGEVITLGGYIIDTTTGKMCIRFANYVIDPSSAKIAVDITFTRTDVG